MSYDTYVFKGYLEVYVFRREVDIATLETTPRLPHWVGNP
jgi:hypothetical protein